MNKKELRNDMIIGWVVFFGGFAMILFAIFGTFVGEGIRVFAGGFGMIVCGYAFIVHLYKMY